MSKSNRRTHARRAQGHPFASGEFLTEPTDNRHHRLELLLLSEIQSILRDHAVDPALEGIDPLRVTLSPDSGHARIAFAVVTRDDERIAAPRAQKALIHATAFVRARLAQLNLKKLPRLTFTFVGVVR